MKNTTYTTIDYNNFDKLVNETFPCVKNKYECICENEWDNDTSHIYDNVDGSDSEEIDINDSEDFRYAANAVLHNLVKLGNLPAGNYIIEVSW